MRVGIGGRFGDAIFKARVLQCVPDGSVDLYLSPFCEPLAGFFSRIRSVRSVTIDRGASSHFGHGEHVHWSVPIDIDTNFPRFPDQWAVNFVGSYSGCPPTTMEQWFGKFAHVLDGLPQRRFDRPTLYFDLTLSSAREQILAQIRQRLPDFDIVFPNRATDVLDNLLTAAACTERLTNFDGGMVLLASVGLSTIVDLGPRAGIDHRLFAAPEAALKRSEEFFDYLLWRLTWRYAHRTSPFLLGRRGGEDRWALRPRQSLPRDVALLTGYDANMRTAGAVSAENKRRYCARHGYAFYCDCDLGRHGRHPAWGKIPLLLQHLPHHEWVFWSDADSVIMNYGPRLENFFDDGYDAVFSTGTNGINTGNFFLRNTSWSTAFLNAVWGQEQFKEHVWREQASIQHLINSRVDHTQHVLILPNKVFNGHLDDGSYEDWDFMLHLAGYAGRDDLIPRYAAIAKARADFGG